LDAAETLVSDPPSAPDDRLELGRLMSLIQKLRPSDKQVMLLYLEGFEGEAIAQIAGISPSSVATKIHRIKNVLANQFHQGATAMNVDDIRSSWQAQPAALATFTSTLLRRKAWLQAWKVKLTAIVDVVLIGAFGIMLLATAYVSETWLCRVGCVLAGSGYLYTAYRRFSMAAIPARPADAALQSCIAFYRANLNRRRDAADNWLSWVGLPSAPGVVLALLGWVTSSPGQWMSVSGVAAFWVGFNLAAWRVSTRQCGEIRAELALLDALE
jgi:DNA-binding CsgD family transcriptional regulator